MTRSLISVLALACGLALGAATASAGVATALIEHDTHAYAWQSPTPRDGSRVTQGQVLASHVVRIPEAQWLRLVLRSPELAGGAVLRITSLTDGAQQHLNAETVKQWQGTSAYFNGNAVLVELLAGNDARASVGIAQVLAGKPQVLAESQCGPTDDRVDSAVPYSARLMDVGCTANLMAQGCFTTAAHCMSKSGAAVVEFNVPKSQGNGNVVHPAPKDQYTMTATRKFSKVHPIFGSIGDDWAVFTVNPNSETGLTPLQAQGSGLQLATSVPAVGQTIQLDGYGVDSGTDNQTLQLSLGPITDVDLTKTSFAYRADSEGGNSGSAVVLSADGTMVGVHTNAGCTASGGANQGTLFANTDFLGAVDEVCGGAIPAPTCDDIEDLGGYCKNAKMTLTAALTSSDHDGQTMTASVDGVSHQATIEGDGASLVLTGLSDGPHVVKLQSPAGCEPVHIITCK